MDRLQSQLPDETNHHIEDSLKNENAEDQDENKNDDDDMSGGCNSDGEKEDVEEEFEIDRNLPMLEWFPMRKTYQFQHLTISSDFDAGNMRKWEEATEVIADPDDFEKARGQPKKFDIWISPDGLPYLSSGMKTWFYFYVKGALPSESIKFTIKNMNKQAKLYNMGLRPVFRVIPKGRNWQRIPGPTTWNKGNCGLEINFEHTFNWSPNDRVYFAFTYPYSYVDIQNKLDKIDDHLKSPDYDYIYYHRELLGYSIENRRVDLITLSSKEGITKEHEDLIENWFPEHGEDRSRRPVKFENKKVIFLTARVHPGETPASFVLNGIIDLLLNKSREQGKRLLNNFVFKIIPCLNPDGWARGYFRLDTNCQNLNRYYTDPTLEKQPTIYVSKKAIVQQSEYGVLQYYIDLHAHASKIGWFLFGNALKGDQLLDNYILAKMISMNSLNFDITECSFSEKNMKVKDKGDGLSREGSGRVAIYKATNCTHCYTLEWNYASGKKLSHLPAKFNIENNCIEPESWLTDRKGQLYKNKPPVYNMEIFEQIGRATVISFLDLAGDNPVSRVPKSIYKDVANMRLELSLQYNINVAAAKKIKEEMLRK
jgi:cytosolic carboxypeptidase protein 5